MSADHGEALDRLAAKVSDHSTVLQAIQIDMQHIVKAVEKMVGVSERQVDLGHQLERNNDSIKRAFDQMSLHKADLTAAIDNLADAFKLDRSEARAIATTVGGFSASLRTLKYVGGSVVTLLVVIATMFAASVNKDIETRSSAARDKHTQQDQERTALSIKVDALSMQVQEVRLDRQRDRESEAKP